MPLENKHILVHKWVHLLVQKERPLICRMLRATLSAQRDVALHTIAKHFPAGVRATQPEGGGF